MQSSVDIERIVHEVLRRLERSSAPTEAPARAPSVHTAVVTDRVVTLESLAGRIDGTVKYVDVAANAVVTPSVRDLLKDKNVQLRLLRSNSAAADSKPVWIGWDGGLDAELPHAVHQCRAVELAPSGSLRQQISWLERKIVARQHCAGLLLSARPLLAAALANRRSNFRAAVVNQASDVVAAGEELDANLLVASSTTHADVLQTLMAAVRELSPANPTVQGLEDRATSSPLKRSR